VVQQLQHQGNFGSDSTWVLSRSGDICLDCWLDVTLPAISTTATANSRTGWVPNIGHNIIEKATMKVQQIEAHTLSSYDLDCYRQYCVPKGKQVGYDNMIGNVSTNHNAGSAPAAVVTIGATPISVPLPFWFSHDSGNALPMCAIPYNEITVTVRFRKLSQVAWQTAGNATATHKDVTDITAHPGTGLLTNQQLNSHYVVLTSTERQALSCPTTPRKICFKEFQDVYTGSNAQKVSAGVSTSSYQLQLSHPVTELYFSYENRGWGTAQALGAAAPGVTNQTPELYWSNYTNVATQLVQAGGATFDQLPHTGVTHADANGGISSVSLSYDNMKKYDVAPVLYTACVQPYYFASNIPETTGYNLLSSCLHSGLDQVDPTGSVNHAKINTTTLGVTFNAGNDDHGHFNLTAANWNIVQIQGGAIGYPYY
jgi:hypothetical protein